MRLNYKQIERQHLMDVAAYQYLADWYGPHVPYKNKALVNYIVWCVQNGVSEEELKKYLKKTYDISPAL